jgi:hypothetical protein
MIVDHPYLDNNGPTYAYGVCENGDCGRKVSAHEFMIRQKKTGSRRFIASTSDWEFVRWWKNGDSKA